MGRNRFLLFLFACILAGSSLLIGAPLAPSVARAAGADKVFVVNSASDPYPPDNTCDLIGTGDGCTLRDAINLASTAPTSNTVEIRFNIPRFTPGYSNENVVGFAVETWTITLTQALPFIDHDNITIDGTTQENFITGNQNPFGPTVIINGSQLPTNSSGLTIRSNNNVIKNLGIVNFVGTPGVGIDIRSRVIAGVPKGDNNTVQGCYIGINRIGTAAAPNNYGIWIRSSNNLIGGRTSLQGQLNVISGNLVDGIRLEDGTTNKIQGNYIGLNAPGSLAVPNKLNGIYVYLSDGNVIGATSADTDATRANIISGNTSNGVSIQDSDSNLIAGNLIGLSTTGNAALPNGAAGVRIESSGGRAQNNQVGDAAGFTRNVISGNTATGVRILGDNTTGTKVFNNLIGPNANGGLISGSTQAGIAIDGADNTTIGGIGASQGNVISGNGGDAIAISGNAASSETSSNTAIVANTIGLNEARSLVLPNAGRGVNANGSVKQIVVGGAAPAGNVIAGNGSDAVYIAGGNDHVIAGNAIGVRRDANPPLGTGGYTVATPNNGDGISVAAARSVLIGGATSDLGNIIGSNTGNGISITGVTSSTVRFNQVGGITVGTNSYARGNGKIGLVAGGIGDARTLPTPTTVTSGTLIRDNTFANNQQGGIQLTNTYTSTIDTNTVNQNVGSGITVNTGFNVKISKSTIYSNTLNGVLVSAGAQRVSVLDTKFTRNGGKAISLTPATPDANGNPLNSNHDINPPFNLRLNQARQVTGQVLVDASKAASCITCTLQFFAADPKLLDSQGRDQLVLTSVKADKSGYFTATLSTLPAQLVVNANDNTGNTSEFTALTVTPKLVISNYGPAARFASPTESISYTFRVTNTGTLDLTDIQLKATSSKNWPIDVAPKTLSLKAASGALPAEGQPVVVTLTLPIGTDPRVIAGTIDTAIVTATSAFTATATASAQARTTVRSAFVLAVDPNARNGQGVSTDEDNLDVVLYQHALSNTGNLTGTVTLTATTDLFNPLNPQNWKTTIDQAQVTLAPGQTKTVTVRVAVPFGATAGTIARTTLKVTQTDPLPQKTSYYTDTTTVAASRKATIAPNRVGDAGATETISFEHTVINFSNEQQVTFKLSGGSSLGSKVSFRGITGPLGSGNTFTVGNQASNNTFRFFVDITVDSRAMRGDTDTATVTLSDANDVVVGGVQDIINVTRSAVIPRLYLPLIFQS